MAEEAGHPRVFLGITELAGYYGNLAQGFAAHDVPVTVVDLLGHQFRYERSPHSPRWISAASATLRWIRGDAGMGLSFRKACWGVLRQIAAVVVMVWAVPRHDVFVFSFGTTFLRGHDLPLLRRLGKTVILVFHGSDARPAYLSPAQLSDGPPDGDRLARHVRRRKRSLRRLERHCDHLICHPTYGHLFSRPMVMFVAVGIPFAASGDDVVPAPAGRDRTMRVLHAPSKPVMKGTPLIRAAVQALRDRGLDVELVEISGRPHAEVMEAVRDCDLVVDQAYSDTPMAGLATEASSCGRVALVGGYDLPTIMRQEQDPGLPCPTVCCEPEGLEGALHDLVVDEERCRKLAEKAAAFVKAEWSPEQVAERYLQIIGGTWPAHLVRDPADIRYVHGCGLSAERSRAAIRAVVEVGGTAALQLNDKPQVLAAVLHHAGLSSQSAPG